MLPARRLALLLLSASLVALTTGAAGAPAGAATLPAGSFAFDGTVYGVTHHGSSTYVAGTFTGERAPSGSGLAVDTTGGAVDPSSFPQVAGDVRTAVSDGAGGWYVGGYFRSVGSHQAYNLAHIRADGAADPAFAPVVEGPVQTLVRSGSTLYVGGHFAQVDEQPRQNLAALSTVDGSLLTWSPTVSDPSYADVETLALSGSTMYVGGSFSSFGGQARNGLAAADAGTGAVSSWNPSPDGGDEFSPVLSIVRSGSTVYVAGGFSQIGGQPRSRLAAVDASTGLATSWNPAPDDRALELAVDGSTVYAAGFFTTIGGQPRHGLAALDATTGSASAWNPAPDGFPEAIAVAGPTVYVGGSFTAIGGQARTNAAAVSAASGSATAWDPQPAGDVETIAIVGDRAYVGGAYSSAGPLLASVRGVAKLDADGGLDTAWHPNPDGSVYAIGVSGSTAYLGGSFGLVAGQTRDNLAAVDTGSGAATAWNPDAQGWITGLAVGASQIYATLGGPMVIGGQSRGCFAGLDLTTGVATAWNPDANDNVHACNRTPPWGGGHLVAEDGALGRVYVGYGTIMSGNTIHGGFKAVDPATGAFQAWSPQLANGAQPTDVVAAGGTVYVAAVYASSIGGQPRNGLAALDATTGLATGWDPEPDGYVTSIAVTGSSVLVGGVFTAMGDTHGLGNLASLDATTGTPSSWHPALDGTVHAVATDGTDVYVGGEFTSVDGHVTGPFAQLRLGGDGGGSPDTTAPTITVDVPTEGQHLAQGAVLSSVFTCADGAGTGVATCAGPSLVDTATAGDHTFTVATGDHAGNSATKTVHYVVDAPASGTVTPNAGDNLAPGGAPGSGIVTPSTPPAAKPPVAAPSAAAIRTFLSAVIAPPARQAVATLRKTGSATLSLRSPGAGTVKLSWYQSTTAARTPVLLATGTAKATRTGALHLTIRLTKAGRRVLRRTHRVKVAAKATFTPAGGAATTSAKTYTLRK